MFALIAAKLQLVLMLTMFPGIAVCVSAQGGVDIPESTVLLAALPTLSPNSSVKPSQGQYSDLKLSYSVRYLAHLAGLPPNTIFHLCWDFNFLFMLALIGWKGGPLLVEALQARSRSIRFAIDEAQRLAADGAKQLAKVEERWAQLDSEISAMRTLAEAEMNYEEQVLNARTTEDIRRIMEYSRSEIDRAVLRARCELKAFTAGLAVSIARESIQIDTRTDQELVKGFTRGITYEFAQTGRTPTRAQIDPELVARK